MHVAEQRGGEVETPSRHLGWGLPARGAFGDSLIDEGADALKLHGSDDRTHVDVLVEGRTNAKGAHTAANLVDQDFGDALLHQKARAGAADLSLIEPDTIDQAFDGAVEVGVFENHERGFAAQFERQPLMALRSGSADGAADFGGSGESDFIHAGVLHQSLAGGTVAGDYVDYARGQGDLLANLGEGERGKRSEFGGLQHHGISGGEGRSNFPGEHEQGKIPGDDLPDDAAGGVAGELRLE